MRDDRPSRTAYRVALLRAAHQLVDDPPVFGDPLAIRIVDRDTAAILGEGRGRLASSLRAFLAVRSRVAEDELARSGGGGVVFDYGVAPSRLDWRRRLVFAMMAAHVKAVGEPWVSVFEPETLRDEMHQLGFLDVADLGPDELNARYFAGRADGLRVGGLAHVMVARMGDAR